MDAAVKVARWAVYAALMVVFVAGLATIAGFTGQNTQAAPQKVKLPPTWPDAEAEAFAVNAARALLTYNPKQALLYQHRLERYASADLGENVVPEWPRTAGAQSVGGAAVARVERVSDTRALITVSAAVINKFQHWTVRYLTIPVLRDKTGLAVNELPSFSAPPAKAADAADINETLAGDERAPIGDVLKRFLRAYLEGDQLALEAEIVPGRELVPLTDTMKFEAVDPPSLAASISGAVRAVNATVTAVDTAGVRFHLNYRVILQREGARWFVWSINEGAQK